MRSSFTTLTAMIKSYLGSIQHTHGEAQQYSSSVGMEEKFFYNPTEHLLIPEMQKKAIKLMKQTIDPFSPQWNEAIRILGEAVEIERRYKCRAAHGKR